MRFYIFLPLFLLSLISCENKTAKEIDSLNEELIKAHDKVMPKSLRIDGIIAKIDKKSINQKDSSAQEIVKELKLSSDNMYKWMKEFGDELKNDKKDAKKLAHYQELKQSILQIEEQTNSSIEKANQYLK